MVTRSSRALSPVGRSPLYERLVERLRAHIVEASLTAGDRLPPERQLAEQLGVSRASIRQAIVVLEVQGLVEVRHGGGTFVRRANLDGRRLSDFLDAREALEVKLAELAAARRSEADLRSIDSSLDLMAAEVGSAGRGEQGDAAFHEAITAAAHSELLAEMYAGLADDIRSCRHESLGQAGRPVVSLAQHRAVAKAVATGNASAAARAMRAHLRSVAQITLLSGTVPAG
jgi:GntR family transcriptional regulator, transcriptional repressor for pyruvate dehydrogenase complex